MYVYSVAERPLFIYNVINAASYFTSYRLFKIMYMYNIYIYIYIYVAITAINNATYACNVNHRKISYHHKFYFPILASYISIS